MAIIQLFALRWRKPTNGVKWRKVAIKREADTPCEKAGLSGEIGYIELLLKGLGDNIIDAEVKVDK